TCGHAPTKSCSIGNPAAPRLGCKARPSCKESENCAILAETDACGARGRNRTCFKFRPTEDYRCALPYLLRLASSHLTLSVPPRFSRKRQDDWEIPTHTPCKL